MFIPPPITCRMLPLQISLCGNFMHLNYFQNAKPAAYSQIEENELDNEGEQDSKEEDEEY